MSNVIFFGTYSRKEEQIRFESLKLSRWKKDFKEDSEDSSLDLPSDKSEEEI